MPTIHPQLCARPKGKPRLKRPMLEHPALGVLEYINRDGGWWQGTTSIAQSPARLDLQHGSKVPAEALDRAAAALRWLQDHEPQIRSFAENRLKAGKVRSNMTAHESGVPKLTDTSLVALLTPCMVVLWDDRSELWYACDELPDSNLLGAHRIEVSIEAETPQSVLLMSDDYAGAAQRVLAMPIPAEAHDWENSNRLPVCGDLLGKCRQIASGEVDR